ncbi:methyltransferase domain-containing protein [Saccharomonospora sp. NPDC046836]|uniref:methyltransferase domain-containing protein n=1 Tax=Saccharomonospora sp. NPDC046836 TaxID=3156921 RepID=UPI0033EB8826
MTEPDHDRLRWNERYVTSVPEFAAHPLLDVAMRTGFPAGPVLELACGRSGSALALAAAGRAVVAVDVSDVALGQLAAEAARRGLADSIDCVRADLLRYAPGQECYAFVLATRYWEPTVFAAACSAVTQGGLIAWEALALAPGASAAQRWHVRHGELSSLLPSRFDVLTEDVVASGERYTTRLLARARRG